MSQKKRRKNPAAESVAPPATGVLAPSRKRSWPVEFCPPRRALGIGIVLGSLALVLLSAAAADNLLWLKRVIAWGLGLKNPEWILDPMLPVFYPYGISSWDIAYLLFMLATIIGAALVHPSCGITLLLFFRFWLDGYTFPTENLYFIWAVLAIAAIWCVREMKSGASLRAAGLALLLLLFVAVCLVTVPAAVQWDRPRFHVLLWFSYFLLFWVAANSLQNAAPRKIFTIGLFLTIFIQCTYAILQYEFLVSYLRTIIKDPKLLQSFFGVSEMTPEIARRMNINRAFGNFIFPPALAAFVILLLPYTTVTTLGAWRRFRTQWRHAGRLPDQTPRDVWLSALATALFVAFLLYAIMWFALSFVQTEPPAMLTGWKPAFISLAMGVAVFLFLYILGASRGATFVRATVAAVFLTVTLITAVWALIIAYSRGAWLAFFLAIACCILFWLGMRWRTRKRLPSAPSALMLCFLAGLASVLAVAVSQAQAPPVSAPDVEVGSEAPVTAVVQEGIDVGWDEFLSTASLGLRVSYWQVGLRMFLHNFWTGVGLGNFGSAYPTYQFIGAGDVQEAHNQYIQVFSETGLFGGALFISFWAAFLLSALFRIIRFGGDFRLLKLSLLAGILAFLLHSAVDINFQNPSLVTLLMVMSGLLWASLSPSRPRHARPPLFRAAAVGLLIVIALAFGISMRVYLQQLALGKVAYIGLDRQGDKWFQYQYDTAAALLKTLGEEMRSPSESPPQIELRHLMAFGFDIDAVTKMGKLYAPVGATRGMRPLRSGETLAGGHTLVITDANAAFQESAKAAQRWLEELARIDARSPHNAELALTITSGYRMLNNRLPLRKDRERRVRLLADYLHWAEVGVRRSPYQKEMFSALAEALLLHARKLPAQSLEYLQQAAQAFERAIDLAPIQLDVRRRYAATLEQLATAYTDAGDEQAASACNERAAEARRAWDELYAKRWPKAYAKKVKKGDEVHATDQ